MIKFCVEFEFSKRVADKKKLKTINYRFFLFFLAFLPFPPPAASFNNASCALTLFFNFGIREPKLKYNWNSILILGKAV